MNTSRRIQRHLIKALAAGALLAASALPVALATTAGAATAPTLTSVTSAANGGSGITASITGTFSISVTASSTAATITAVGPGTSATLVKGDVVTAANDIGGTDTIAVGGTVTAGTPLAITLATAATGTVSEAATITGPGGTQVYATGTTTPTFNVSWTGGTSTLSLNVVTPASAAGITVTILAGDIITAPGLGTAGNTAVVSDTSDTLTNNAVTAIGVSAALNATTNTGEAVTSIISSAANGSVADDSVGSFTITPNAGSTTAVVNAVGTGTSATLVAGDVVTAVGLSGAGSTTDTIGVGGTVTAGTPLAVTLGTAALDTESAETATFALAAAAAIVPTGTGTFTLSTTISSATATIMANGGANNPAATLVPGDIITAAGFTGATDTIATVTSGGIATANVPLTITLGVVAAATETNEPATITTAGGSSGLVFGEGGLPAAGLAILVNGTGFAANGSNASLVSSDPDLSFTNVTEVSPTQISATLFTIGATTSGSESITLTDVNGTSLPLLGYITVNPDPTVTSISPTAIANGQTSTAFTVVGTGFESGALLFFTSTVDGTTLENPAGIAATITGTTTLTVGGGIKAVNAVTGKAATNGTYVLTVYNPDGGSVTTGPIFTVASFGATNVSPASVKTSAIAVPLIITGSGFEAGASVTLGTGCTNVALVAGTTVVENPNAVAVEVTTTAAGTEVCQLIVTNPSIGGGNGAASTILLGVNADTSPNAPTITSVTMSPTTALSPGTGEGVTNGVVDPAAASMTIVGSGFDPNLGDTVTAYIGTSAVADNAVVSSCTVAVAGTSIVCSVAIANNAYAGPHSITVLNGGGGAVSNAFANALSIAGPAITSMSPAAIAVGTAIGTVITLTGTGFTNTTSGVVAPNGDGAFNGLFAVTSPTTATLTVTVSPTGYSLGNPATLTLTQVGANGWTVNSSPFYLVVVPAPTIASITYASTPIVTTGVGAGATAQKILINGTGFLTGITVSKFVNAYGVADTGVVATVTAVNAAGTQITATLAVPAGDVNISDGYTVTNLNGGVKSVAAFGAGSLVIDSGPTITSVAPTTATIDTTAIYTITGTGFTTTSVVSTNGTNATCGTAVYVSSTSLTASCTFGAAGTTGVSLVVTNADGGSATSAVLLAAAAPPTTTTTTPVPPVKKGPFSTKATAAVVGRTTTVTITGGNFYGSPKVTSNEAGTTARVFKDSGTLLTLHVTVKAGSRTGEHTFTIRNADGKSCKANYRVKA